MEGKDNIDRNLHSYVSFKENTSFYLSSRLNRHEMERKDNGLWYVRLYIHRFCFVKSQLYLSVIQFVLSVIHI